MDLAFGVGWCSLRLNTAIRFQALGGMGPKMNVTKTSRNLYIFHENSQGDKIFGVIT